MCQLIYLIYQCNLLCGGDDAANKDAFASVCVCVLHDDDTCHHVHQQHQIQEHECNGKLFHLVIANAFL